MNQVTSNITEAAGTMVETILKAETNLDKVRGAYAYIRETDEMLSVHTDVTPLDIDELFKSFGVVMSTGEISDHLWAIEHEEENGDPQGTPEAAPAPVPAPPAGKEKFGSFAEANIFAAWLNSIFGEGYFAHISPRSTPVEYYSIGIFCGERKSPHARCMFTISGSKEWNQIEKFILSIAL